MEIAPHEAAGPTRGHSSAAQAGDIARQAEVGTLYLIHYPTGQYEQGDLAADASRRFPGPVALATDFMTLEF